MCSPYKPYRYAATVCKPRPMRVLCLQSIRACIYELLGVIFPDSVASSLNETGRTLDELERTITEMMTDSGVDH